MGRSRLDHPFDLHRPKHHPPTFRQHPAVRTTFQSVAVEMAVLHQGSKIRAWVGITTTTTVAIGRFPPPPPRQRDPNSTENYLACGKSLPRHNQKGPSHCWWYCWSLGSPTLWALPPWWPHHQSPHHCAAPRPSRQTTSPPKKSAPRLSWLTWLTHSTWIAECLPLGRLLPPASRECPCGGAMFVVQWSGSK